MRVTVTCDDMDDDAAIRMGGKRGNEYRTTVLTSWPLPLVVDLAIAPRHAAKRTRNRGLKAIIMYRTKVEVVDNKKLVGCLK
jgi:hypothetical protein